MPLFKLQSESSFKDALFHQICSLSGLYNFCLLNFAAPEKYTDNSKYEWIKCYVFLNSERSYRHWLHWPVWGPLYCNCFCVVQCTDWTRCIVSVASPHWGPLYGSPPSLTAVPAPPYWPPPPSLVLIQGPALEAL